MIWMVAAMVALVAGVASVRLLLHPASGLRINIFRPWQGDPWPRGVQEENEVRFDWAAPARLRRAALLPDWSDIVVTPTTPDPVDETIVTAGPVEELSGGSVVVEHLEGVDVHRPRH